MENLQLVIYLNMALETLRTDREHIEKKLEKSMSARDKRGLLEELRLVKLQIKALEYAARFFKSTNAKVVAKQKRAASSHLVAPTPMKGGR